MFVEKIKKVLFTDFKWKINNILFKSLVFFGILFLVGDISNALVLLANDLKMPVFCDNIEINPQTNKRGGVETRLNILADWIDLNDDSTIHRKIKEINQKHPKVNNFFKILKYPYDKNGIASPGDILRWLSLSSVMINTFFLIILLFSEKLCALIKMKPSE